MIPDSQSRSSQVDLERTFPTFIEVNRVAITSRTIGNIFSISRLCESEIVADDFHGMHIKTHFSEVGRASFSVHLGSQRPTAAKPVLQSLVEDDSEVVIGTRLQCDELPWYSQRHVVTVNSDWVLTSLTHVNKVMAVRRVTSFYHFSAIVEFCSNWRKLTV